MCDYLFCVSHAFILVHMCISVYNSDVLYTLFMSRAGRYRGILVMPWYWNQMIRVSSKFQ